MVWLLTDKEEILESIATQENKVYNGSYVTTQYMKPKEKVPKNW